jgi:hypothetical protein
VLNAKFLAEKTGLNPSLPPQYVQAQKTIRKANKMDN